MRKIFTIAIREYRAMVGTRAFVISLAMMPIMMFGGLLAMDLMKRTEKVHERRIVVIDHTGELVDTLIVTAGEYNAAISSLADDKNSKNDPSPMSRADQYRLESLPPEAVDDQKRLELSQQIRDQQLYAFVEIPAHIANPDSTESVAFHASDATLSQARRWFTTTLNELISTRRLVAAGIDPLVVQQARKPVRVAAKGLFQQSASGKIAASAERDELTAIFLPMTVMMLMFMVIFMASQPMLESVLEEKSSRVVEVLLGSVNPMQLMTGKLLGTVGGSLTIMAVYLVGMVLAARSRGLWEFIPWELVPWFIVFQILGVLFFASIFMAIGSAVSQLKEAQAMLLPVWLLLMLPLFVWFQIIREPNGNLAFALTWIPPASPSTVLLRMATGTVIPSWQVWGALLLLVLSTTGCIYLAARIFRVGILWQGKTPRMTELLRWGLGMNR